MKKSFDIYVILHGMGRIISVDAFTASQALSLAKMRATPAEVREATFTIA